MAHAHAHCCARVSLPHRDATNMIHAAVWKAYRRTSAVMAISCAACAAGATAVAKVAAAPAMASCKRAHGSMRELLLKSRSSAISLCRPAASGRAARWGAAAVGRALRKATHLLLLAKGRHLDDLLGHGLCGDGAGGDAGGDGHDG